MQLLGTVPDSWQTLYKELAIIRITYQTNPRLGLLLSRLGTHGEYFCQINYFFCKIYIHTIKLKYKREPIADTLKPRSHPFCTHLYAINLLINTCLLFWAVRYAKLMLSTSHMGQKINAPEGISTSEG